ncbi:MAG: hypothetical protein KDJ86_04845 [Bauldia sp.]|uniref:calcium-binding protein n=1 Tax=Bauldia sp. TaxID=2575872 RepID=UPI001D4CA8EA|nr:calcium-binding protein [Bauldia sp.]MCB1495092.1 hypothetical protein [Bauldia sp.]
MVVKIESFEGVTTTPNSPNYEHEDNDFWHQPGYLDEYTFASGLKLLGPIPNRENGGVWTGDFSQGTADDWFNDTDDILNAGDVPDGNAYIGAYDDHGFILFGLGAAYTVSALVTGYDGAPNALVAYDENQKLITGASIKSVAVDDWGHNIIQVTSKKPIAYVVFAGDYIVVDRLQFDTSKPDVIKGDKDGGKVRGTNSDDLMLGKKANDKFIAKDGDDTLYGKKGNDKLHGKDGNDTLIGGKDKDKLWGEDGQDTFVFDTVATQDKLKDFNPDDDTILLSRAAFTEINTGLLDSGAFVLGSASVDAGSRILYDPATGRLYYDEDGTGSIAPVEVARLPAGLAVSHEDFFVA